tara:strand:+ start:683 stop:10600 length:9918 start_codon:yes stop_codon:yes gene_type:complete
MSAHLQGQGYYGPNFFEPTLSDLVSPISGAGAGVPDIEVQQPVIYDEERMQFENLLLNEEQNERLRQSEREKHKWKEEQEKKVRETKEYKEWERAHTVWMQRVRDYRAKLEKWKAGGGSEESFVQKFGPEPDSTDEVPERPRIVWEKDPRGFMEIDPRGGTWSQKNQQLQEQQQAQADAAETQEQQIRRQRLDERKRFEKERREAILNSPDAINLVDSLLDSHGNILPGRYSPRKLPELNDEPLYEGFKNWYTQNPLVKGAAWDDRIEGDAFAELIRRRVDQRTRLEALQASLDKEWERSGAKASGQPRPDARQHLERQRLQAQQAHEEKERRLQERHEQRRQDALVDPNALAAGAEEMLGFDPTSASLMGLVQMGVEDPGERTPREFKWDTGDELDVILPHMRKPSAEDWVESEARKVDRPRQVESLRPGHRKFDPEHSGRPDEDWSEELPLSESLTLDILDWGQTTANAFAEFGALVGIKQDLEEGGGGWGDDGDQDVVNLPFPGPSLKEQYIKEHAENRRKWFEHQSKNPVVQSRQLVWDYIYQKKPITFQDGSSVNLWELPEEQTRQYLKSILKQNHPDLDDEKIEALIDHAYKTSAAAQVEVNTFQIDLKAAEENLRRNDLYQGQEWTTTESLLDNANKLEDLGRVVMTGPFSRYVPDLVPETKRRKVSNKAADQNKKITESYEDLRDYLEQRGFWGELEKVEEIYENFRIETGWQQAKAQHIGHLYDSLKKENASESKIFRAIGEANKLSKKEYVLATQRLQARRSKDLAWYYSDILNLPESSNLTKLALWSLTVGEEAVGMIGTGVFGVGGAIGVPGFETMGLRWKALLDNHNLAVNELEKLHLSPNIAKMSAPTRNAMSFLVAAGITGQFAPWMSSMGGATALAGATSFGDGYLELRKEGGSQENSVAYGLLLAAAEVAPMMLAARLGKVIPGAEGILRHFKPGGVLSAKGPIASVTKSAVRQAFKSIALAPAAVASEVWQESLTAIGESIAAGYFIDRERMSKGAIAEAVSQAIVGAIVGAGFGETISATGATINQFEFNRKIKNQAIKELTDFGKTSFEINQALMMSNPEGVLAFVDSPTRTRLAKILPGAKLSGPMRQRLADSLRPMANSLREFRGTLRWHAVTVVHNGETSVIRVQAANQREAEQRAREQIKGVGIVPSINLEGFVEKYSAQPTPETETPTAKEEPQYDRFGFDKDGFDKDGVTEYGKIKHPTWPGKPIALNVRQAEAMLKAVSERTIPREYPIDVDKVKETLKKGIEIAKQRIAALGGDWTRGPTEPTPQPTPEPAPTETKWDYEKDGKLPVGTRVRVGGMEFSVERSNGYVLSGRHKDGFIEIDTRNVDAFVVEKPQPAQPTPEPTPQPTPEPTPQPTEGKTYKIKPGKIIRSLSDILGKTSEYKQKGKKDWVDPISIIDGPDDALQTLNMWRAYHGDTATRHTERETIEVRVPGTSTLDYDHTSTAELNEIDVDPSKPGLSATIEKGARITEVKLVFRNSEGHPLAMARVSGTSWMRSRSGPPTILALAAKKGTGSSRALLSVASVLASTGALTNPNNLLSLEAANLLHKLFEKHGEVSPAPAETTPAPTPQPTPTEAAEGASVPADPSTFEVGPGARKDASRPVFKPRTMTPEQQKKLYNFSKQPGVKLKDIVKKYDEIMETTPEEKQARRQHAFVLYGESEAGNWAGGIDKGTTVGTITKDGALNERHGSGRTNVAFSASDPDVKVADKIGKDKAQKEKILETLYPGAKFKEGIATGFRNQGIVGPPTRKPATPKPTAGEKAEQREIKAAQKKRAEQKKERENDRVWKDLRKRSPKGTKQTVSVPIKIGGESQNVKVDALVLDDTWAITRGIVDIDGKPVLVDRKRMTDDQWREHKSSQWNLTHLSSGLSAATASQINLRQLYQMIQDSGVKVPKSWAELKKDDAAMKTLKELRSAWDASDLSLLPDNLRQKFLDSVKVPDPGVTADMILDSGDLVKTKGLKVIKELVKEVPEIAYNPIFIVDENKKLVFRDHYTYRLSPGIFNLAAGELSVGQSIGINLPDLGIKKITDKNEVIKKVLKAQGYRVSQGEARKQEIIDGIQWDQKKTQSDIIAKAKLSPAKTQASGKPSREATPPMRTAPDDAESAPLQSRPQTTPVPRIPVDPLPLPEGKTPEAPADIIFSAKLGRQPIKGKLPKQTLGTYSPATGRIVIKYGNDLDTAAHELGHFVDDAASIGADLLVVQKHKSTITNADGTTQPVEIEITEYTDEAKAMLDEMMGFAQHGSIEATGPRSNHHYVAGEAIAEWIRAYLVNPDATLKQAPVFSKFMLSRLQKRAPEALKKLREFGDKIRVHGGLSGVNKTISNVKFEGFGGDGESLITLGLNNVAAFTQEIVSRIWRDTGHAFNPGFYSKLQVWFGDSLDPAMHGIDVLKARHGDFINPLKDPEILIRNLQGQMTQWEDQLLHGPIDWKAWLAGDGVVRLGSAQGVGNLQYLFAPLDMTSADTLKRDVRLLHAFMIAERHIERSEVIDEKAFFKLLEEIGLITAELESTVKARKEDGLDIPQELEEELSLYKKAVALAEGKINSTKYGDGKYLAGLQTIWINLGDLPIGKKTARIIEANNKQRQHMIGSGAGLEGDLRVSKRTLDEINALPPEDVSRLRDAAERYRAFADAMILKPMLHFGRISREQYNEIKADNQFYVNMRRIVDSNNLITADPTKAMGSTGVTTTKSVIKKFFGSTEPIGNIYANMLQIGQIAQHDAQRNYALQQMAELAESKPRRMYEGPALNLAEIMHRVEKGDSNAVKIYINGKETYWRMHPEIKKALDGIGKDVSLPALFTILPRILRNTITYFPAFMVRNIIRDTFTRPHLSNVGSQLRHTFQALGKTAEASEFMLGGGGQFGHYLKSRVDYVAHMHRATRELIKDKNVTVMTREQISKGWEKYKSLAEGSEKLNRLAEFRVAKKKALDAGLSESDAILYAAYEARDLLDFAVSGSVMKYVNQMVPFTNAAVQALRRAVKQLHKDWKGLFAAWLKYSVVPELMVYAWNMTGSEEERDEYRQLPAWRKDFYYNIRLGPNTWLAIPKPYEFGVLASGVTRAIDVISGGATREQGLEGWWTSLLKSFSPVDIKAMAGPFATFLEYTTNYDFFKGKPIIPPYEEKQDVRTRKGTERGSNVGKFLQTLSLQTVDSRNWDHILVGLFGSTGRAVVEVSDLGEPGSLNNWGRSIGLLTGITRDGGATSARDVVFVTEWAMKNGHDRKKSYKEFKKLFEEYYTATSNKERQRIARHILAKARGVRKKIESGFPGDDPFSAYRVYLKQD